MTDQNSVTNHQAVPEVVEQPEKREPLGLFFWICVGWLTLNAIAAIFGPWLPLHDVNAMESMPGEAPSWAHWWGTDQLGRDIFARVIIGSRISLGISLGAMGIGFGVGGILGMLAAFRRGVLDIIATSITFMFLAFPAIIGVIAVLSFWQPASLGKITLVIGITSIPLVYRVVRAATLATASKEYVTAAQVMGARDGRILLRELLPNIAPTALSFLLFGIATVIVFEGVLAFLGLSIPTYVSPSWGNMINASTDAINSTPRNWPLIIFPSLMLCLFVLCLNFVGDRLRSYFDVTEVKL